MPDHNTPQSGDQQRQEEATQYEQLVASQRKEVAGQTSTGNARDLGTAGGGMIPDGAAGGSGNACGGMGTPEGGATGGQGTNQNIIDPMTSRAPEHVQDQEEARKAEQKKDTEEQ